VAFQCFQETHSVANFFSLLTEKNKIIGNTLTLIQIKKKLEKNSESTYTKTKVNPEISALRKKRDTQPE